jgi:Tfp pilus assembly protein PilN
MINLLPPDVKTGYHYARRNYGLRKWVVMFAIAFVGLGALTTYGLLTIHESINHNNTQVSSAQAQLQKENLTSTEKQVQDVTSSLKLSVKVLSQEVLFSKLIQQIGAAIPDGAILSSLQITGVSGGLDLTADTTNYTTATQVQVNLASPSNKIFAKADIVSINCGQSGSNPAYPCAVTLRALFSTNNPFLFINQGTAKS